MIYLIISVLLFNFNKIWYNSSWWYKSVKCSCYVKVIVGRYIIKFIFLYVQYN